MFIIRLYKKCRVVIFLGVMILQPDHCTYRLPECVDLRIQGRGPKVDEEETSRY